MFLRFVTTEIDSESRVEAGVFVAAYDLYYSDRLPLYVEERLRDIFDWFNVYLKEPTRFTRFWRRRGSRRGVCWFRPSAREHLARVHELVAILEENDVPVWRLKAPKVGYVVYEDEHQVVAEPVADLFCLRG